MPKPAPSAGRVNLLAEEYLENFNLPQDDTMVYACGHPGMIADLKGKLPSEGYPRSRSFCLEVLKNMNHGGWYRLIG